MELATTLFGAGKMRDAGAIRMHSSLVTRHSSLRFLRMAAQEALPVLLVLYPLLLLLDGREPGFVRSVVNPHWFLLAMIVVGIVVGDGESAHSRREGEQLQLMFALAVAIVTGFWVWWRIQAGMLGVIVALLTAAAIVGAAYALRARDV